MTRSTHKQITVRRTGGPDVLTIEEVPTPAPIGDQVRVRVHAAGVAFGDVLLREGIRRDPRPPMVPGYDVAGIIDAVGPDAPTDLLGQHVAAWTGGAGGYSEMITVPTWSAVPHASDLDPAKVVAVVLNYTTAWQMLHRVARCRAGDRVLVHGGAGGVGTAMLQLLRGTGIEVYATASRPKHDIVTSLDAHPIDYRTEDFVSIVKAAGGANAAFDPVGGDSWRRSLRALTGAGILVGYGFSAATVNGRRRLSKAVPAALRQPIVTAMTLMQQTRTIAGYRVERLAEQRPDWFNADLNHLLDLLTKGVIDPLIAGQYRLDQAADAHRRLGSADLTGKLVLRMD
ncbi:zinc-binding dehydrogenase [Mycobacterium sp. 050134]|uniref:zinc-binding dehydrogenase n=1 Tax=Mycobacterium sp. 050134 TaxID=3096111 RepID=UPI002ED93603